MARDTEAFLELVDSHIEESQIELWEGTLRDYVKMVIENPSIHMGAHQRVLRMIESAGVEKDEEGRVVKYNFFEDDLFGVEEAIEELMSYLRASAAGSEVGRRILLLYGPTSSGKSQLAILLKRGLERFSRTDEGAVYCLSDSPMHEDPLTAIPLDLRDRFRDDYGIRIQGELSPYMDTVLKEQYDGDIMKLPVRRYIINERSRSSIGTFVPSDKKSQDISELVGSMDLSKIGKYGSESDPRAYKFDGELMVSNRGMMEFVEMLKVDQKFLYVLLTLAQEKNIKTGRFPLIYADEFILAHTNETEYNRFLAKDEMEALHDRTIVVKVPYNLSVSNEVRIYEKLINQADFEGIHVAPHSLECAATFAVLSRLQRSDHQGLTSLKKLKLYNGDDVEGFTSKEAEQFKAEFSDEGMGGISPRYVINRIATKLADDSKGYITPIDVIRSLRDGLKSNPKISEEDVGALDSIFTTVIEEFNKMAKNDVQKAFFLNFDKEIQNLLRNYLDHVDAYLDGGGLTDEWGAPTTPDERLMRSIEEKIKVTDSGKHSFREEVSRKMHRSASSSGDFSYRDHPQLREALEKQLFEERQDIIRLTVSTRNPDEKELAKINVVIETLVEKHGYTAESANELLRYVNSLMARN